VISTVFSHLGVALMRSMAWLPLPWVRALGWLLGWLLYWAVPSRRKVVAKNLSLCFPELSVPVLKGLERGVFTYFAQAWLDRGWLWHAPMQVVNRRIRITGAVHALDGSSPTIIFAPHFMGMDAGGAALTANVPRPFTSIYTDQSNKVVDAWILNGRKRAGNTRMFGRADGVREITQSLRAGELMYLLPDMDFGDKGAEFVPFFGMATATVSSLSRFARLGKAHVVPVVTRLTPTGYDVQIWPAWDNFPTSDAHADTARMNAELEGYIRSMPAQYYWVHKRFKTRPPGQPELY
jgi:Kdo2-lipid IVA lauroyltransferase/acyltransferase